MASVTFDGVSKVYDNGFRAVDNLDLEIRDGEFMVLVGPSGLRQDDGAAHARRPGRDQRGRAGHRRPASSTTSRRRSATSRWSSRTTRCIRTSAVYDNMAYGLKIQKLEQGRRSASACRRSPA